MSVIELKDVSKSYGQGEAKVNALKNINAKLLTTYS